MGYLALGGSTATSPTAVFFHMKPDGTAGLLASDGGWHAGRYRLEQWLHVTIWLDWAPRTAQLSDRPMTFKGLVLYKRTP